MITPTVPVRIGDCQCPGTPHPEGDIVNLRGKIGLAAGVQIQRLMVRQAGADAEAITGQLAEAYLLLGVESWNLLDADGQPVPVNEDTIRDQLLEDFERGVNPAEVADGLYTGPVLDPLVQRQRGSSSSTTTGGLISATPTGPAKARKGSRRSSTSTSQTAVTATTSG